MDYIPNTIEFIVYGLGLPVGLILFFSNKKKILSYLNSNFLFYFHKNNRIETIDYFRFNPFSPSLKKWELSYRDGKFDGLCIQWYKNGKKRDETNWKQDKKDGLDRLWDENENILQERSWKNDVLDGKYTQWYENGQKRLEANYKDGKLDGKQTQWYESGQVELEATFKDGECISGDCA
jgi:antitoxin component YwqK of YwqJK toxin-antitoxin module